MALRSAVLAALLALALGGCGADRRAVGQGGFVAGETLSIWLSLPRADRSAEAMVDGAKLALADAEGRAGPWKVNLGMRDDSAPDGGTDRVEAVDNAREITRDPQAVAVIGDLDSEAARHTAPLLNAAGILQVSPGAGYAGLTGRAEPDEPARYAPAGAREPTYVRLVASDRALVPALIDAAGPAEPVLVEHGPGRAAADLARALVARAREVGLALTDSQRRAGVLIYAGDDPRTAEGVFESAHRANPRIRFVGGDALARSDLARRLPRRARARLRLVSNAPPLERGFFAQRFRERFGRAPSPYAAVGYEAVALVLDGIARTGEDANVRPKLNAAVRSARRRGTLLGSYAIDPRTGDTNRTQTTLLGP